MAQVRVYQPAHLAQRGHITQIKVQTHLLHALVAPQGAAHAHHLQVAQAVQADII